MLRPAAVTFRPMDLRRLPARGEVLLAAGVLGLAAVELAANTAVAPKAAAVPLEVMLGTALAWRRRAPLIVTFVVAVLATIEAVAGVPLAQPIVPLLASVIATYTVVSHQSLRPAAAGAAVMVAAVGTQTAVQHKGVGNFVFGLIFIAGAWVIGGLVHARTRENVALHAETGRLVEEREAQTKQAAAAERGRIARELHDVIAHSVSVMVVQAGAAEQVVAREPGRAVEAMRAVQDSGRQALSEMAHLLGMLRDGGRELGLVPQPGPAHTAVILRYLPGALEAEVSDDGSASPNGYAGGHGLIGMQERANLYGGTMHAGPGPCGGYVVRASIPVEII